jgi:hypothetical protein
MFASLACEEAERPTEYETHLEEPSTSFMLWVSAPIFHKLIVTYIGSVARKSETF